MNSLTFQALKVSVVIISLLNPVDDIIELHFYWNYPTHYSWEVAFPFVYNLKERCLFLFFVAFELLLSAWCTSQSDVDSCLNSCDCSE